MEPQVFGDPRVLASFFAKLREKQYERVVVMCGDGDVASQHSVDEAVPGPPCRTQEINRGQPSERYDLADYRTKPWPLLLETGEMITQQTSEKMHPQAPSPAVSLVQALYRRGQLLKVYTESISNFSQAAGVPCNLVVKCWGNVTHTNCSGPAQCRHRIPTIALKCAFDDIRGYKDRITRYSLFAHELRLCDSADSGVLASFRHILREKGKRRHMNHYSAPCCPMCGHPARPDIVLSDEISPLNFSREREILRQADFLIVIGTTLSREPLSELHRLVTAPRILIGSRCVGDFTAFFGANSVQQSLSLSAFLRDFCSPSETVDDTNQGAPRGAPKAGSPRSPADETNARFLKQPLRTEFLRDGVPELEAIDEQWKAALEAHGKYFFLQGQPQQILDGIRQHFGVTHAYYQQHDPPEDDRDEGESRKYGSITHTLSYAPPTPRRMRHSPLAYKDQFETELIGTDGWIVVLIQSQRLWPGNAHVFHTKIMEGDGGTVLQPTSRNIQFLPDWTQLRPDFAMTEVIAVSMSLVQFMRFSERATADGRFLSDQTPMSELYRRRFNISSDQALAQSVSRPLRINMQQLSPKAQECLSSKGYPGYMAAWANELGDSFTIGSFTVSASIRAIVDVLGVRAHAISITDVASYHGFPEQCAAYFVTYPILRASGFVQHFMKRPQRSLINTIQSLMSSEPVLAVDRHSALLLVSTALLARESLAFLDVRFGVRTAPHMHPYIHQLAALSDACRVLVMPQDSVPPVVYCFAAAILLNFDVILRPDNLEDNTTSVSVSYPCISDSLSASLEAQLASERRQFETNDAEAIQAPYDPKVPQHQHDPAAQASEYLRRRVYRPLFGHWASSFFGYFSGNASPSHPPSGPQLSRAFIEPFCCSHAAVIEHAMKRANSMCTFTRHPGTGLACAVEATASLRHEARDGTAHSQMTLAFRPAGVHTAPIDVLRSVEGNRIPRMLSAVGAYTLHHSLWEHPAMAKTVLEAELSVLLSSLFHQRCRVQVTTLTHAPGDDLPGLCLVTIFWARPCVYDRPVTTCPGAKRMRLSECLSQQYMEQHSRIEAPGIISGSEALIVYTARLVLESALSRIGFRSGTPEEYAPLPWAKPGTVRVLRSDFPITRFLDIAALLGANMCRFFSGEHRTTQSRWTQQPMNSELMALMTDSATQHVDTVPCSVADTMWEIAQRNNHSVAAHEIIGLRALGESCNDDWDGRRFEQLDQLVQRWRGALGHSDGADPPPLVLVPDQMGLPCPPISPAALTRLLASVLPLEFADVRHTPLDPHFMAVAAQMLARPMVSETIVHMMENDYRSQMMGPDAPGFSSFFAQIDRDVSTGSRSQMPPLGAEMCQLAHRLLVPGGGLRADVAGTIDAAEQLLREVRIPLRSESDVAVHQRDDATRLTLHLPRERSGRIAKFLQLPQILTTHSVLGTAILSATMMSKHFLDAIGSLNSRVAGSHERFASEIAWTVFDANLLHSMLCTRIASEPHLARSPAESGPLLSTGVPVLESLGDAAAEEEIALYDAYHRLPGPTSRIAAKGDSATITQYPLTASPAQ